MDSKNAPSMLRSTVIGGGALGAFSGLPFVFYLNYCCCALVAGAGFLAAFLYSRECRKNEAEFGPAAGAGVGLVAGLFYTIGTAVVSLVSAGMMMAVFGRPDLRAQFDEVIDLYQERGVDTEYVEIMFDWFLSASPVLLVMVGACFLLLLSAVFSTAGGLIGGIVFKVVPAPPAAPAPPIAPPSETPPPPTEPPSLP